MTDIIDALDEYMVGLLGAECHAYGLCETVKKGAAIMPVTVDDRKQVAINDRFDVQWYHRIISSGSVPKDEDSFGDTIAKEQQVRIRTVFASKHKKGEQIRYDFANGIPSVMTISGFRRVDFDENVTIIEDQEGVYNQEFGAGDYEKHITAWNIVAIEHQINFIRCEAAVCP